MTPPRQATNLHDATSYRPDVDGLRAVAVFAVILYHVKNALLPGGFVGVDCFFVISGFVVTGSILRSDTERGLDDLKRFWRRRWLRIIPPLIVFVIVTTLLGALLIPPFPRETYTGSIRSGVAATLGVANLYLYRIGLDYFQADQTSNLFSHTWSLGVEEQFYVLFSLVAIGLPALVLRRRREVRLVVVVGLTALSIGWFIVKSGRDPVATYYSLPARFWELGIGSCLSMFMYRPIRRLNSPFLSNVLAMLAISALVAAAVIGPPLKVFPVASIATAVIATVVLIFLGSTNNLVSRALSLRPVVFVGLLSYSLYLWHWPILTLFRFTIGLDRVSHTVLAICLTVVLAYLSYRFVERPSRHSRRPFIRDLLPKFAMAFAAAIGVSIALQAWPGIAYAGSTQNWDEWLPRPSFAYAPDGHITQGECLLHGGGAVPTRLPSNCTVQKLNAVALPGPTLFAVGDSHAFSDWPMLSSVPSNSRFQVTAFAHDGCSANSPIKARGPSCQSYWLWVTNVVRTQLKPGDAVFVSFLWSLFGTEALNPAFSQLADITEAARKAGVYVIVEAPLPTFERSAVNCLQEFYRTDYSGCSVGRAQFEERRREAMQRLSDIASSTPAFSVWDPTPLLCADSCHTVVNGKPVFRDSNHLSYRQSRSLGENFSTFLERVTLGSKNDSRQMYPAPLPAE